MNTCPIMNLLFVHALGRVPLDERAIALAFRLLDRTPHRA